MISWWLYNEQGSRQRASIGKGWGITVDIALMKLLNVGEIDELRSP